MNSRRETNWIGVCLIVLGVGAAPGNGALVTNAPALPSPLTLEAALDFAWYEHPAMKASRLDLENAGDLRALATLWPDPSIGVDVSEELDQKRSIGISLAQTFELGGKRPARVDMAEARKVLAEAGLLDTWLSVRAGIQEAFVRLRYATEMRELTEERAALNEERLTFLQALFDHGKVPERDMLAAASHRFNSDVLLGQAGHSVREAERRLVAATGAPAVDAPLDWIPPTNSLAEVSNDFSEWVRLVREGNAGLLTARARTMIAEANARVARAGRWSDVTVGVEGRAIEFETGGETEGYGVGVRMPLPLRNRRREDLDNARRAVEVSEEDQAATQSAVMAELAGLLAAAERSSEEHGSLALKQIPLAERQVELAESLCRAGKASRISVIEERLKLITLRSQRVRQARLAGVASIGLDRVANVTFPPAE